MSAQSHPFIISPSSRIPGLIRKLSRPQTHCCLLILKICFHLSFLQHLFIAQPQASCGGERQIPPS